MRGQWDKGGRDQDKLGGEARPCIGRPRGEATRLVRRSSKAASKAAPPCPLPVQLVRCGAFCACHVCSAGDALCLPATEETRGRFWRSRRRHVVVPLRATPGYGGSSRGGGDMPLKVVVSLVPTLHTRTIRPQRQDAWKSAVGQGGQTRDKLGGEVQLLVSTYWLACCKAAAAAAARQHHPIGRCSTGTVEVSSSHGCSQV